MVFSDAATLRDRLAVIAMAHRVSKPATAAKVAFAYAGEGSHWAGVDKALYETEPVARAVLDRCEAVFREERGESLLDAMFARDESEETLDDPVRRESASYALACALTALWSSVGIRPSVVIGKEAGEIAAARAAGVLDLEDGLRLAAAAGEPESGSRGVAIGVPSIGLVSGATGRLVEPSDAPDWASRHRPACEPAPLERCADTLAGLGVEVIVEIAPLAVFGAKLARAWPSMANGSDGPLLIESLRRPPVVETGRAATSVTGFVDAVAEAWEAGLSVSFAGLFAGEMRRRIALPGYPFQRQRYWLPKPRGHTAASD